MYRRLHFLFAYKRDRIDQQISWPGGPIKSSKADRAGVFVFFLNADVFPVVACLLREWQSEIRASLVYS